MAKEAFVAIFFSLCVAAFTYVPPRDCIQTKQDLSCRHSIPHQLPEAVKNVYIKDYKNTYIGYGRFSHSTWRHVKQFDLNANVETSLYIRNFDFLGLENVTTLGIHARKGNVIEDKAFVGVALVEKLDFSNMIALAPSTFIKPLLYDGVMPKLRTLILENVNTDAFYFNISRSFLQLLRTKGVTELSLRGANLYLEPDANSISTYIKILDISNVSFSFTKSFSMNIFPHLTVLNISSIESRYFSSIRIVNNSFHYCDGAGLDYGSSKTLKIVLANFILVDQEVYISNATVTLAEPCFQMLKVFQMRGNNLHYINGKLHVPGNFALKELDLSLNGMKFLSAAVLRELINLENLYLHGNLLSSMSNHPDFKILFQPLQKLKRLSLANNKLSHIPDQMFHYSKNLQWIDLHGNYLKSVSFLNLPHSNLKLLNISNNMIAYLVSDDFTKLKMVTSGNGSTIKGISMNGNPFRCSCESVEFLQWIEKQPIEGNSTRVIWDMTPWL